MRARRPQKQTAGGEVVVSCQCACLCMRARVRARVRVRVCAYTFDACACAAFSWAGIAVLIPGLTPPLPPRAFVALLLHLIYMPRPRLTPPLHCLLTLRYASGRSLRLCTNTNVGGLALTCAVAIQRGNTQEGRRDNEAATRLAAAERPGYARACARAHVGRLDVRTFGRFASSPCPPRGPRPATVKHPPPAATCVMKRIF